ncbi:MAG: hypothetical protein FJ098_17390 [Deltaproteobacteria bacterium]|nr:hypothetical protein [Deltaproteobacteria bacterium]
METEEGEDLCTLTCTTSDHCPDGWECDGALLPEPWRGLCRPQHVCFPDCAGRTCGPDGCGGTSGACPPGEACAAGGACLPSTTDPCSPTWEWAPAPTGPGVAPRPRTPTSARATAAGARTRVRSPGTTTWCSSGPAPRSSTRAPRTAARRSSRSGSTRTPSPTAANPAPSRVEDRGPGVPAHLAGRIFEPFFTTKPMDRGTGLGLSLSLRLAREHGGELHHEPRPGGGTRFHLDLRAEGRPA